MSTPPLSDPAAREALAAYVAANTQRAERQLREALASFYTDLGMTDLSSLYNDLDGWGWAQGGAVGMPPPNVLMRSQKRGEYLPVFINEEQLFFARARSRKLAAENEFAQNVISNRQNYTVGEGLTYTAGIRGHRGEPSGDLQKLVKQTQDVIDLFAEANELNEREADTVERCDRDGESIHRLFPQDNGLLLVRTVEPEHLRSPVGDGYGARHSFGVETRPGDVESVVGYWIVEDPVTKSNPVFVPADEILHFKANVPKNAKRGVPTFYSVESNLRRAEDLLASMTGMAKARAKIALIRKLKGTVQATAESLVNSLTAATATDPATGLTRNLEQLSIGSILTTSDNIDYEVPGANVDAAAFVQILETELRAIAARCVMPAWMLLTNSSDSNFATALVAEAPSTKQFKRLQKYFTQRFGTNRIPGPNLSLIWRQLRHAVRCRILLPQVLTLIEVKAEGASLVVRDQAAEATTNKTYFDMGVKSVPKIRAELSLDNDEMDADFQRYPRPQQQPTPGGPGAIGGKPAGDPGAARPRGVRENVTDDAGHDHADDGKFTGHAAATRAMRQANPHPGSIEPEPPGTGRDDLVAANPALRAARARHDAHRDAYLRHQAAAVAADTLHGQARRLLPPEPDASPARQVRLYRKAQERHTEAEQALFALSGRHAEHAAATHEGGPAALADARTVARGRLDAAAANLQQHAVERFRKSKQSPLPESVRDDDDDPQERAEAYADLLLALYGDRALEAYNSMDALRESVGPLREAWNAGLHPRGKGGRFIPKNSQEAVSAAGEAVKHALSKPHSPHAVGELLTHLNILTTKQIHALKKEHGLSASGKNREELVKKIADRLNRGRRAEGNPESSAHSPLQTNPNSDRIGTGEKPVSDAKGKAVTTQELPKLEGSEKQVTFADKVRQEKLSNFDREIGRWQEMAADPETPDVGKGRAARMLGLYREARDAYAGLTHAGAVLDSKSASPKEIVLALFGTKDGIGKEFGARNAFARAGIKHQQRLSNKQHADLNVTGFYDPEGGAA